MTKPVLCFVIDKGRKDFLVERDLLLSLSRNMRVKNKGPIGPLKIASVKLVQTVSIVEPAFSLIVKVCSIRLVSLAKSNTLPLNAADRNNGPLFRGLLCFTKIENNYLKY
jgi:hypothetical protein